MANKQIEALEKLIALKDETIKELERQVQLLKNQPPVVITQPQQPIQPFSPTAPIPLWPNPQWPYGTWITCETPLTIGSNSITIDPTATCTLTNSDGSTNVIDFKTCSRV